MGVSREEEIVVISRHRHTVYMSFISFFIFSFFHLFLLSLATHSTLYKPAISILPPQSVITETEVSHTYLYLRTLYLQYLVHLRYMIKKYSPL